MEIGKQVKVILAGGEALAHEIEAAILDIVISNAAGIERFRERREELTNVNYQFLFLYAVGLVLVFASGAGSWTEEEINSVIDMAAEEIVREGKESEEASFTLILGYVTRVYPAFATWFGTGNTEFLAKLVQSFGLISISAYRYVSD